MTKGLEIKYKHILNSWGINTPLRLAHFFAQLYAESGLMPKRESLYYTKISGLRTNFKSPFKNKSDAFVSQYLKNSIACANYVYANRMGNGNEASGDGFKYRGGGYLQHTGFNQFHRISLALGIDLLENPEKIEEEEIAFISACWYWNVNNLNQYADKDNLDAVSDIINIGKNTPKTYGDANGFNDRKEALLLMKKHFKL